MSKTLREMVAHAILDAGYNFNAGSFEGPMEAQREAHRRADEALKSYVAPSDERLFDLLEGITRPFREGSAPWNLKGGFARGTGGADIQEFLIPQIIEMFLRLEDLECWAEAERGTKKAKYREAAAIEFALVDQFEDDAYTLWTKKTPSEDDLYEAGEYVKRSIACRQRGEALLKMAEAS